MDPYLYVILGFFLIVVVLAIGKRYYKVVTIYEFQKGLRYKNGKMGRVLGSGRYYYFAPTTTIITMDTRPKIVTVAGQEVLTSDSVSIKVSIALKYRVSDAVTAMNSSEDYSSALYTTVQAVLRSLIAETTADELLQVRNELGRKLFEATSEQAAAYGLELLSAGIRDIMFAGELKKVFAQVIKAQKEGLAALEKARGESAALRSLCNAAKMLDENPNLAWLRMIQAVSDTSGNTIVVNLSPHDSVLPLIKRSSQAKPSQPKSEEG